MAIFRAETKSISRGSGHNLVAALSYRAGMALTDTNEFNPDAITYDYTKKTDVVHREILVPALLKKKLDDADIALDFQYIANLVETGETTLRGKMKQSARLGREWVLCGVPELSRAENIQLFQQFAKEQGEEQDVISMCFVHDPKAGNDTRSKLSEPSDERNIHAHIVLLTRKVELTKANTLKLGSKSDSELSNDDRVRPVVPENLVGTIDPSTELKIKQGRGLCSNSEWIKNVRKSWADILNEKLLEKGVQPVTHKSYRELGIDIVPTVHVGNNELSESKREQNVGINERNNAVVKSAADSIIDASSERGREPVAAVKTSRDRIREQIAKSAADERNKANQQRIAERNQGTVYTKSVCDRVAEFNTRQARKLDAESAGAGEPVGNSAADERIRDSERWVEEQDRAIALSILVCDRVAEFDPRPTRATEDRTGKIYTREERSREREQLVARSTRDESFYKHTVVSALRCHEKNVGLIANRLAWRKQRQTKYDDRQMKELDAFYKTLGVKDFTLAELVELRAGVDAVKDKLTDEIIINNHQVVAILRDPVVERESYLAKTSQNASGSIEMVKTQNSSLDSSKALESTVDTYERPRNIFRL
uniref:MobA/MobL family protein n=1 Tax=Psychrobacter sp. TaxID=56811 RepID=UPI0015EE96A7|nr:MobA/MobL family protein [Psychrobacter sp.]